jgi:hypothetical protein
MPARDLRTDRDLPVTLSRAGWPPAPARTKGSQAKAKTRSGPRKYGVVCQLAVEKRTRLRSMPPPAAARVNSPAVTRRPIVISTIATPIPASSGCGSAKVRSRKPPGVPAAKSVSWVPM